MKKWIVWLLVILILTISCIYLLIPSKIAISRKIIVPANINGVFRNINGEDKWEKWWRDSEGKPHVNGEPFYFNGSVFRLIKYEHNAVGVEIEQKDLKLQSLLTLVSFSADSSGTTWQCEVPADRNPISRLVKYNQALKISKSLNGILQNLKLFVSNPKNLYGFKIYKTSTWDTTMLSAKFISTSNPSTSEIYGYLDVVERNIKKQHASISGLPIINVRNLDSGHFETQVAIPTNHLLENTGEVFYRRMLPGNFICAEVKGGPSAIQDAYRQLNFYVTDYSKSKMAKPFEQLVTNRLKEQDTSKWITRIYQPVAQ